MILGVDYSHWQAGVDANKLKDNGVQFGIVKAGQVVPDTSKLYYDGYHDLNIKRLKEAGIPCGNYYYWLPKMGASKQARHYIEIYNKNKPDFPPILDVEDAQGLIKQEVAMQLKATIQYIEDKMGISPIIYTRGGFWVNSVGDPSWGANYKFWLAQYNTVMDRYSKIIKPNILMWQFTDKLKLPGCPSMDGNYWMASDIEFRKITGQKDIFTSSLAKIQYKRSLRTKSKRMKE